MVLATGSPSVVLNPTSNITYAYVIGDNGRLYYYNTSNASWADAGVPNPQVPLTATGSPGAVYRPTDGSVTVFVVVSDGSLAMAGPPSGWLNVGAPPGGDLGGRALATGSPAVIYQPSDNSISAFVVSNIGFLDVYNTVTGWTGLGQPLPNGVLAAGSPSVVYQTAIDRTAVFVVGGDETGSGQLYCYFYDHGQADKGTWQTIGSPPGLFLAVAGIVGEDASIGSPSATYQSTLNRIHVFAASNNSFLCLAYFDQGWQWEIHSGPGTDEMHSPNAFYWASSDSVIAHVVRGDGNLYENAYVKEANKWAWAEIGAPTNSFLSSSPCTVEPTVANPGGFHNPISIYAIGRDGHLYGNETVILGTRWFDLGTPQ